MSTVTVSTWAYCILSLSQEKENYLKEKEKKKIKLNKTYNYQIKNRIPELPRYYPDNEVTITFITEIIVY